jgi:hypothetical protein
VTISGRGVLGPCFPLGSHSSMIFTLIPRTPYKTVRKNLLATLIHNNKMNKQISEISGTKMNKQLENVGDKKIVSCNKEEQKQTCLRSTCLTAESM